MEVVSTSNLVSSQNEETTASNFQTMAMKSSAMQHDLMTGQIGSYAYIKI